MSVIWISGAACQPVVLYVGLVEGSARLESVECGVWSVECGVCWSAVTWTPWDLFSVVILETHNHRQIVVS
jgi:hypothetical protein